MVYDGWIADLHIRKLAGTIAEQATAIEQNTVIGPLGGAVARLINNVETLKAWTIALNETSNNE